MSRLFCFAVAWNWLWLWTCCVEAHQPDTSYLTLQIGESGIEAVYATDVTTLQRLVPELDADHNRLISRDEGEASRPVVERYLREHLFLDIDSKEATWGDARPLRWPAADLSPIPEAEWHQVLLQYPFHLPRETLPREVRVTCDVFIELGVTHKILGDFRITDQVKHPVVFTLEEPDYYFDVTHALRRTHGLTLVAAATIASPAQLIRRGVATGSRPSILLMLLALLVTAPIRRGGVVVAAFALGELVAAVPVTLAGSPMGPSWVQLSQALALILAASANLWELKPESTFDRLFRPGTGIALGLIQGLQSGAAAREACLAPLQPAECLASFQVGVLLTVGCAATGLTLVLVALGAFRPGSTLPKAVSIGLLICGLGRLLLWITASR